MHRQRGIDLSTLLVASVASAAAALVVSQFWIRGTPIAAAVTPVIIALVSEMLHRPTKRIADRLTREQQPLPEAAAAAPPPASEEDEPRPVPEQTREQAPEPAQEGAQEDEMRVYRSNGSRRRIAWRLALVTGLLAFLIAAAALTIPELITGQSLVNPDRRTTLGGREKQPQDEERDQQDGDRRERERAPADEDEPDRTVTETVPAEPQRERSPPARETPPDDTETTPTEPDSTETAPSGS